MARREVGEEFLKFVFEYTNVPEGREGFKTACNKLKSSILQQDKEVKRLKELMDQLETMYLDLTLAYLDVEEKNQKEQEKMKKS